MRRGGFGIVLFCFNLEVKNQEPLGLKLEQVVQLGLLAEEEEEGDPFRRQTAAAVVSEKRGSCAAFSSKEHNLSPADYLSWGFYINIFYEKLTQPSVTVFSSVQDLSRYWSRFPQKATWGYFVVTSLRSFLLPITRRGGSLAFSSYLVFVMS